MHRMLGDHARRSLAVSALALVLTLVSAPIGVGAEENVAATSAFFPDTGHTADALFLDIYRQQPDLVGEPVTEEFQGRSNFSAAGGDNQLIQYYENLALVYVPDAEPGNQLQPLEIGVEALRLQLAQSPPNTLQQAARRSACGPALGESCFMFPVAGHTLTGDFLDYWLGNDGAWLLGAPLTEPYRAPDGSLIQYFRSGALRAGSNGIAPLPLAAIQARIQNLDTRPLTQPAGVPIYDENLYPEDTWVEEDPAITEESTAADEAMPVADADGLDADAFGPGPQQGAWKEVVVSISRQKMWAYENGEVVMSSFVSTGTGNVPETVTPYGFFSVLSKYDSQTMEGVIGGEEYLVPDVPNVMYFDNLGNALHGAYWHNNFGSPMSHGCINLPLDIASWMFGWAPVGTAVSVIE